MHKNPVWLTFLIFLTAIVLVFIGTTVYKIYPYFYLDSKTTTSDIEWSLEKINHWGLSELMGWGEDLYALIGNYTFEVENKTYQNSMILHDTLFRSRWAGEQELISLGQTPVDVWFYSKNPHFSSLRKTFPVKECVSSVLLLGVLLYFIWLGFKVGQYTTK